VGVSKRYVGWIVREKNEVLNDRYFVQSVDRPGVRPLMMGYGAEGVFASVAFFEQDVVHREGNLKSAVRGLNLGKVALEETPIGLRVFVEEEKKP
jgi:hypothetical protein